MYESNAVSAKLAAQNAENNSIGSRASRWLDHERRLGYLMVAPAITVLVLLVAYPFFVSIWLSFTDTQIARADTGTFVGLENFTKLLDRRVFRDEVIQNTIVYTVGAVPIKLVLGLALALLMNRPFPLRGLVRGLILIPWVLPTSLSMTIFVWLFEPTQSVLNYTLTGFGLGEVRWLGYDNALYTVMAVNIWRGTPFFGVVLLAALQGVPVDQMEAAEIDGANIFQRFWNVTIPHIFPVIVVATLFSVVRTFAEMEIVWILTRGGPLDSTHMIGTYAYQRAIVNSRIGEGAAISVFFFPIMALIVFFQLWYLQRRAE